MLRKPAMLAAASALICAGAVAGCGNASNPAVGGSGQSGGTVIVASETGPIETVQQQQAVPLLAKQNIQVQFVEGDYTNIPTKLKVQAKGVAPYDVVELQDTNQQELKDDGLLAPLDLAKIPNYKYVDPDLKNPYWIPFIQSAGVLVYNKDKVKPAPTSYSVLFDPKYKGRVAALNYQQYLYAAAAYVKHGSPGTDWDAGWPALRSIAPTLQIATTSWAPMGQGLEDGQAWLGLTFQSWAHQWSTAGGAPLGVVVPKEGSNAVVFDLAIPKNAPNKAAAYAYINAMLAPSVQQGFAKAISYAPVTTNAGLSPALESAVEVPSAERSLVYPMNTQYVVQNDQRWYTLWTQQVVK